MSQRLSARQEECLRLTAFLTDKEIAVRLGLSEAALDAFSPMGANDPVRSHLMRGLADDAVQSDPRELLRQVLSAGWVMAQVGAQSSLPSGA